MLCLEKKKNLSSFNIQAIKKTPSVSLHLQCQNAGKQQMLWQRKDRGDALASESSVWARLCEIVPTVRIKTSVCLCETGGLKMKKKKRRKGEASSVTQWAQITSLCEWCFTFVSSCCESVCEGLCKRVCMCVCVASPVSGPLHNVSLNRPDLFCGHPAGIKY